MPTLDNPKHEAFAQGLAKGMTAGFYVYELADPRDGVVFYVGKGKGRRISQHVAGVRRNRETNAEKALRISQILAAGLCVIERKVWEGLTESEAFRLERRRIAHHGIANLTNRSRGEMAAVDRSKARAKVTLINLKSRQAWLSERDWTDDEIKIADWARLELTSIAERGHLSEVEVTAHGLRFR